MNHVAIAALVVNIVGALLLCKGVAFQGAWLYAQEQPAALYPRSTNVPRDVARARDVADAQAGAVLLVLGFLGQVVAALQSHWSTAISIAAYILVVVLIVIAVVARRMLRKRFERALYMAHVDLEFRRWKSPARQASRRAFQQAYRGYLAEHGRGDDLDRWAADVEEWLGFNPTAWEHDDPPDL